MWYWGTGVTCSKQVPGQHRELGLHSSWWLILCNTGSFAHLLHWRPRPELYCQMRRSLRQYFLLTTKSFCVQVFQFVSPTFINHEFQILFISWVTKCVTGTPHCCRVMIKSLNYRWDWLYGALSVILEAPCIPGSLPDLSRFVRVGLCVAPRRPDLYWKSGCYCLLEISADFTIRPPLSRPQQTLDKEPRFNK